MAVDYTAPTFVGGTPSSTELNAAFAELEAVLRDAVSIQGTIPNALEADLDLNGHDILNLGTNTSVSGGGESSGVIEHGFLTGLNDDDHSIYLTNERGDGRYYTQNQIATILTMYYTKDQIANLLDGFSPATHNHNSLYSLLSHTHASTSPPVTQVVSPAEDTTLTSSTVSISVTNIPSTHHWDFKIMPSADADVFVAGGAPVNVYSDTGVQLPQSAGHSASLSGVPTNGSAISLVYSYYAFDGIAYTDLNRVKVDYTAATIAVAATTVFNGVGTMGDASSWEVITVSGTDQIILSGNDEVLLENKIIVIDGDPRKGVVRFLNATNCTIRNCIFYAPHTAQFYFDGFSSGIEFAAIFLDVSCTNITIEDCNFFGTTHAIFGYKANGTHVKRCSFARQYRHCVFLAHETDNGGRAALIEDCYGHGYPTTDLRTGGSTDGFNLYSCIEPTNGRKHTARNIFFQTGWGVNGSGIIIDGALGPSQQHGGHLIEDVWILDAGNKAFAISGGGNNNIDRGRAYQGPNSPTRFYSSLGRPTYIFDHLSADNPKEPNFVENYITDSEAYWYVETDAFTGTQWGHSMITADTDYAYGHPADTVGYVNCDWIDESLSREQIRQEALTALSHIPVYGVFGEAEMSLVDGWYVD